MIYVKRFKTILELNHENKKDIQFWLCLTEKDQFISFVNSFHSALQRKKLQST